MTYKALGRSIANYAAPVWSTNACESNIGKIQHAPNYPLRIITCSHKMSSIYHLHSEIKMLQVEDHLIQNPFLTAQSTQIKSVISVPIKDFIHHYPRALFNDIPGSGRILTTYPGRGAV